MRNPVVIGGVYYVADDIISLPPNDDRDIHEERRTVIVVTGPETNSDSDWDFVLIVPTSGSTSRRTPFCVKLAAGQGNLTKKCWARVPAVQPLLKSDLQDHCGVIPEQPLKEIQARLAEYMGLLTE
jgi:mRNA-degrading endonuclease toxin of MazEF toxin-antitoxin module